MSAAAKASVRNAHSQNRRTVYPYDAAAWSARRSFRRFLAIFATHKAAFGPEKTVRP
jgi:hypothetical protein